MELSIERMDELQAYTEALAKAIQKRRVVTFEYEKLDGVITRRRFSPWELRPDNGTVLGYDHKRRGVRSFKIDCIVGAVTHDALFFYMPPQTKEA